MIENIRSYTWLIVIVIVVLLLGFIFMDTSSMLRGDAGGGTYLTVQGRSYSQKEYLVLGESPMSLAGSLAQGGFDENTLEIYRFLEALAGNTSAPKLEPPQRFFVSRLLLRDARDRFGVHPSDDQVAGFIQGLSAFRKKPGLGADPMAQGAFDQSVYNEFIQKRIGRIGMSERDFHDLIRDIIAAAKLRDIVAGDLPASRELAEALAVVNAQRLTLEIATLSKETFTKEAEPDEQQLKEYWETVKDAFMTDKRIRVSYILATPDPADQETAPAEGADDDDGTTVGNKSSAAKKLAIAVDSFINELTDADGSNFESLITENEWKLVSTDFFTRDDVPSELTIEPRATSAGEPVVDKLFNLATGPDALAPFTGAIAVGSDQWLIARLDEVEEPRTKTFEEAHDDVRERYINEKAGEAVRAAIAQKLDAVNEAMTSGTPFDEAAQAQGFETKTLGPYAVSDSLDDEFQAREIFAAAATTNPGKIADPLYQEDRVVIPFVKKREIYKDDNRGQQVDNYLSQLSTRAETAAFDAWMNHLWSNARLSGPALP